nr:short-chain type dehydrogenase/reductase [Quercus suber]
MCPNQPRSSPSSTKPRSYSTRLDILVNSAGVTDTKLPSIANTSLEDFDRIFSSLKPGTAACTVSKAAVETMTKILAKDELKGTGITANCIAPGPIATEMFFAGRNEEYVKRVINDCPLGRLKETKDVALVVGFLATDASKWINGQVVRVSGGYI